MWEAGMKAILFLDALASLDLKLSVSESVSESVIHLFPLIPVFPVNPLIPLSDVM